MHLKSGAFLQGGKYRIVRFIKSGGFGCTYEAWHTVFDERVAIKEFFPKDFCNRDESTSHVTVGTQSKQTLVAKLKAKFIAEAKAIHKLKHPGIVKVSDFFEENGTAYYAMDYIDGCSLDDVVKRDGALSEKDALYYISQVCSALSYVHSCNRLHLDIKPGNIMVDKNGRAVLIDFGTSKQYEEENGENTSTLLGMTPGYAPLEQYVRGGVVQFSAPTDIYALGATLYKLVTGQTPPDASDVNENGLPNLILSLSPSIRATIEAAMSPRRKDRPQSIEIFRSIFEVKATAEPDQPKGFDKESFGKEKIGVESEETVCVAAPSTMKSDSYASYKDGVLRVKGIEYPMIPVDGGEFMMGEGGVWSDNHRHRVTLSSYCIGKYEVTQDIWEAVMGSNPSNFKGSRRPVEMVSWDDCQEFIRKLNELTGANFRLPTEAEWEFAARGGNSSRGYKYSGSNSIGAVAWYVDNSGRITHNVGTMSPNELGLYDMSGNVWEWCSDWYEANHYASSSQTNPKGPSSGSYRVRRGGSWSSDARLGRISYRNFNTPDCRCGSLGFRLCL